MTTIRVSRAANAKLFNEVSLAGRYRVKDDNRRDSLTSRDCWPRVKRTATRRKEIREREREREGPVGESSDNYG